MISPHRGSGEGFSGRRRLLSPEQLDATLGVDLLHALFLRFLSGLRLGLVSLDFGDVVGIVDVP
jgi:hypothetical protein